MTQEEMDGVVERLLGSSEEGRRSAERALDALPPEDQVQVLDRAMRQAAECSDLIRSRQLLERHVEAWRELDGGPEAKDRLGLFYALHNLGEVLMMEGNCAAARVALEESLAVGQSVGTSRYLGSARAVLGILALREGDYAAARLLLEEALASGRQTGEPRTTTYMLEMNAALAACLGQAERALRLAGAASTARESNGNPMPAALRHWYDDLFEASWRTLSEDGKRIWEEGRRMELEEAVRFALGEN